MTPDQLASRNGKVLAGFFAAVAIAFLVASLVSNDWLRSLLLIGAATLNVVGAAVILRTASRKAPDPPTTD